MLQCCSSITEFDTFPNPKKNTSQRLLVIYLPTQLIQTLHSTAPPRPSSYSSHTVFSLSTFTRLTPQLPDRQPTLAPRRNKIHPTHEKATRHILQHLLAQIIPIRDGIVRRAVMVTCAIVVNVDHDVGAVRRVAVAVEDLDPRPVVAGGAVWCAVVFYR